jgi:hypothetical protein
MRNADTVLGVIRDRGTRGLPLEDIYRQLFNPVYWLPGSSATSQPRCAARTRPRARRRAGRRALTAAHPSCIARPAQGAPHTHPASSCTRCMPTQAGGGTRVLLSGRGPLLGQPGDAGACRGQRAAGEASGRQAGAGLAPVSGRRPPGSTSGSAVIGVVQAAEHRAGDDVAGVAPLYWLVYWKQFRGGGEAAVLAAATTA